MAANNCTINPVSQEDIDAQKTMSNLMGVWKSIYHSGEYFGHALFNKNSIKNSITDAAKKIRSLEDESLNITGRKSGEKARRKNIRAEINNIKKQSKAYAKDLKDIDKKNITLQSIESRIFNQMAKYAESSVYDINPDLIFGTIRDWIEETYTVPVKKGALHDLELETLVAIDTRLKRTYAKMNKIAAKQELGGVRNTFYDPAAVMFESDPTGAGYALIKKTRTIQDDMNAVINTYKRRFRNIQDNLKGIVSTEGIFYGGTALSDEMNDDEKGKSTENLIEFMHEILDGESRFIRPAAVYADAAMTKLSEDFKIDRVEYTRKLKDAIFSGLMDGEHVQKYIAPSGLQHYYIPIKRVNEDGSEVWNAYEVPWEEFEGRDSFLLPPRIATERAAWKEFFTRDKLESSMEGGWYKAQVYDHLNKINKKKESYTVHTHNAFQKSDRPTISNSVWNEIQGIRNLLREVREEVSQEIETQESKFTEIVNKLLSGEIKNDMSQDEIKELVKSVANLDGMNLNFAVKDGQVYTTNHHFNELENYVPYMYAFTDSLLGLINARDEMNAKILSYNEEHKAAIANGNKEEAVKKDLLKQEALKMVPIFDEKINIALSMKDRNSTDKMNSADLIKFTKSRAGFMNPLKIEKVSVQVDGSTKTDIANNGRRKDFGVFTDYTDSIFRQVHHNSLKADTLNALQGTTKMNADYMFDHVKSSIGRLDTEAGVWNIDYSDAKVVKMLTKMQGKWKQFRGLDDYPPITMEMINNASKIQGMWVSGALLKWGSALTNNFQRISTVIESSLSKWNKANNLLKNYNEQAMRVVEMSGVTDTVVAMADSLMGTAGDLTAISGPIAAKNYWMLKIEKGRFIKSILSNSRYAGKEVAKGLNLSKDERDAGEWWSDAIEGMIENFDPSKKIDARVISDVAEGIWLSSNKLSAVVDDDGKVIKKSSLSNAQITSLKRKLSNIMERDQLNKYVAWSLGGGFASQFDSASIISFTKVEERMRAETFLMGAMMADDSGLIPKEWKDANAEILKSDPTYIYTHPEAQRFGRLLVYNTMYGLSPAYLPKAFKGAVGQTLFKFKPYQWHQMRNEWRTVRNFVDSKGDKGVSGALASILTPGKVLSKTEDKMKSLLLYRGTISALSVGFLYVPIVSDLVRSVKYRVLNSRISSAMSRGGESAILTSVFRTMHLTLALGGLVGGDEEEEKIREEWYRLFLPIYLNVMIDTFFGEDPFKILQLYSRSAHGIATSIKELAE